MELVWARLRRLRDETGGELNLHSARWLNLHSRRGSRRGSWRAFIEGGRTKVASRRGWGEVSAQLQGWLISSPLYLRATGWDFVNDVLQETTRRRLALKPWLASAANDAQQSEMR